MNNILRRDPLRDLADGLNRVQKNRLMLRFFAAGFGVLILFLLRFGQPFRSNLLLWSGLPPCLFMAWACIYFYRASLDGVAGIVELKQSISSFDGPPSAYVVTLLARALRFPSVKSAAWERLIEFLPILEKSEAQQVDDDIWKPLYAASVAMPHADIIIVYDAAIRLGDARAIRSIKAALQSPGLPETSRAELQDKLAALRIATHRWSNET